MALHRGGMSDNLLFHGRNFRAVLSLARFTLLGPRVGPVVKERPTKPNRQETNFTNPLRERSSPTKDHLSTPSRGLPVAQMIGSYSINRHSGTSRLRPPEMVEVHNYRMNQPFVVALIWRYDCIRLFYLAWHFPRELSKSK